MAWPQGTARIPSAGVTAAGEAVDEPDALQRRFNFFDYAADGQLNGALSTAQLQMLAHTLLPLPDAFTITDRARASANGFLLDPTANRNFQELQHLLPSAEVVNPKIVHRFANYSPAKFKVDAGRDQTPGNTFPLYALFAPTRSIQQAVSSSPAPSASTPAAATPATSGTTTTTPAATPSPAGSLATTATTPQATVAPTQGTQPTSTSTSGTTTTPTPTPVQQFVQAALALGANANTGGTTSTQTPSTPASDLGTPITAGTLTPIPAATPIPGFTTTTPASTGTGTTTPAASTTTTQPTAVDPTTSTTSTSTPPTTKVAASTSTKGKGIFNSVIDSVKKMF